MPTRPSGLPSAAMCSKWAASCCTAPISLAIRRSAMPTLVTASARPNAGRGLSGRPLRRCGLANTHAFQARDHFLHEIGQFLKIVHKPHGYAAETRVMQALYLLCNVIGGATNGIAATIAQHRACRVLLPVTCVLFRGPTLGTALGLVQLILMLQRLPVAVVDAVARVLVGFTLGRAAYDGGRNPDLDAPTELGRELLTFCHAVGAILGSATVVEMQIRKADSEIATRR